MDLLNSFFSEVTIAFSRVSSAILYSTHFSEVDTRHSSSRLVVTTLLSSADSISFTISQAALASGESLPNCLTAASASSLAASYADSLISPTSTAGVSSLRRSRFSSWLSMLESMALAWLCSSRRSAICLSNSMHFSASSSTSHCSSRPGLADAAESTLSSRSATSSQASRASSDFAPSSLDAASAREYAASSEDARSGTQVRRRRGATPRWKPSVEGAPKNDTANARRRPNRAI
mmetsp:Transcript_24787/g.72673  ORF Transcript_24787/g.72673 Transcript_24787/m.72673 type:complete len:235 (-) Transcript_24787:37-741(-)